MLYNLTIEYLITEVQENRETLESNGTQQMMVCTDDVDLLGENMRTSKQNIKAPLQAEKEVDLEVNAGKRSMWFYLVTKIQDNVIV
jgi:hypothetical protein